MPASVPPWDKADIFSAGIRYSAGPLALNPVLKNAIIAQILTTPSSLHTEVTAMRGSLLLFSICNPHLPMQPGRSYCCHTLSINSLTMR